MRGDPAVCALCKCWPLRPPEGDAAPPGYRTCFDHQAHKLWDDFCPLFKEDRQEREQRLRFVVKHRQPKE